jgi:hypothetical protein
VLLIIIFKINNFQYYPSSYEGIFLVIIDTQKWKRDYLVKVKIVQSENNLFVGKQYSDIWFVGHTSKISQVCSLCHKFDVDIMFWEERVFDRVNVFFQNRKVIHLQ